MTTLTKTDLIKTVSVKVGLRQTQAKQLVEGFFTEMENLLAAGYSIKLSGFGNFVLHDKQARTGRNPRTSEPFTIAARRVVSFKAGRKLKESL